MLRWFQAIIQFNLNCYLEDAILNIEFNLIIIVRKGPSWGTKYDQMYIIFMKAVNSDIY